CPGPGTSAWPLVTSPPRVSAILSIEGRTDDMVRPPETSRGPLPRSPREIHLKRDGVVRIVALRRRLVLDRRRDRLDQDRLLRVALILDLADDEFDLLVDPVVAFETVGTREHAAVGGVARQPGPVIEREVRLVEPALRHVGDPHTDRPIYLDVVDLEEQAADVLRHIHFISLLFACGALGFPSRCAPRSRRSRRPPRERRRSEVLQPAAVELAAAARLPQAALPK